ncbi:glycosyltransferase [Parolsenella catena]|uniref:glycosyltransferase n=1 Tax=Parolsenella catena TaxID=2003188 RepID=UPI002FDFBA2E
MGAENGASPARKRSVAAVVVTYNRKELLLECLDCLAAQDLGGLGDAYELSVIVVDNASTDGTQEALAPLVASGRLVYHNTGENLGGAGGFNFGMRVAVEAGYDFVWVMDDDCMAHSDTLRELLLAGEGLDGDYGYLTSVCLWTDGNPCTMNRQRHPLHTTIEDFTPELQPCTLASFVSLFVPADVIAELGLPIKDFFIWTDDWEFTRRVSRVHPCYVVGTSVVTHKCKVNGAGNIALDSGERISRFRLAYRNDIVLYRGEGLAGYAYVIARDLNHLSRIVLEAKGRKLERARAVVGGTLEGLRFHPQIEYVRRPEK